MGRHKTIRSNFFAEFILVLSDRMIYLRKTLNGKLNMRKWNERSSFWGAIQSIFFSLVDFFLYDSLADPRGARDARPHPGGPNSFIFMQLSAKI